MDTLSNEIRIAGDGPIVMVDDSEDDFFIVNRMFSRSSLDNELVHCDSAEALFDFLDGRIASDAGMPALVLMDINMPGMTGIEATAHLRRRPDFATIPVVAMLTSSIDSRDRRAAAEAGADAYFVKPMDLTDYVDLFESLRAA